VTLLHLYLILATFCVFDSCLTYYAVNAGPFHELNPLALPGILVKAAVVPGIYPLLNKGSHKHAVKYVFLGTVSVYAMVTASNVIQLLIYWHLL
jgi:hypothetical protein